MVRAAHTMPELEEAAVKQSGAKYVDVDQLAERLELLQQLWPELRERVEAQLVPAEQLREQLQAAGCPTSPSEIGLDDEGLKATYSRAQTIRSRYTILELARETGIFEECLEELFAPGGFHECSG